jgi:hypothetical protein
VADRTREATGERGGQLVQPLRLEAVLTQRLILSAKPVPLRLVGGQLKAADSTEGVACESGHPLEVALGQPPETNRGLPSQVGPCLVVGQSAAPERKAAIASARTSGDLTRLVQAHPHPAPCKRECAGTACHPAPNHNRVGASTRLCNRLLQGIRRCLLLEPVGAAHPRAMLVGPAQP